MSKATSSGTLQPETWVDNHGDHLFRYALLRLRQDAAAEELVQETFLAALQSCDKFTGGSSERTWLVGILKHKIFDHFRKLNKQKYVSNIEDLELEHYEIFQQSGEWVEHFDFEIGPCDWQTNPAVAFEQSEFRERFHHCLSSLPARIASVFTLREIDELSSDEVCKVLEISPTNLWVMLHRARAQLRHCIEIHWFRKSL
jgi:RNA polymerase sigma-70 factor (ECF subfamily)